MLTVVGLDLSLTGTGIATVDLGVGHGITETITPKQTGHGRLATIVDEVHRRATGAQLVVIEGPSYGSTGRGQHERAGLWWLVTHELHLRQVPYAVVPPAVRARYATGRGNAAKTEVLTAVIRRYPDVDVHNDNEADALVLAAMGAHHLCRPLARVPAAHLTALHKVEWPAP